MMMAGIAPPIFSLWRKRAVHGPKDTPGGGFRFPPPGPPLETTQRKGPRPLPLETIPPEPGQRQRKEKQGASSSTHDHWHCSSRAARYQIRKPPPAPNAESRNLQPQSLSKSKKCFSFPPGAAHFLFTKRKWGAHMPAIIMAAIHPPFGESKIIRCVPVATADRNTAAAGGRWPPWPAPPRRRPPE